MKTVSVAKTGHRTDDCHQ